MVTLKETRVLAGIPPKPKECPRCFAAREHLNARRLHADGTYWDCTCTACNHRWLERWTSPSHGRVRHGWGGSR